MKLRIMVKKQMTLQPLPAVAQEFPDTAVGYETIDWFRM